MFSVGRNKFLIDQIRRRMDFPTTIREVRNLCERYPLAGRRLIEDKANGPALIAALKNQIGGLVAIEPYGSKEVRVSAINPEIESGNVYLPDPATLWFLRPFDYNFAERTSPDSMFSS